MGKRKAKKSGGSTGRHPRKEPYDSNRMSAVVDRLRELAARVNALAKAIDDSGVNDVIIDGHAMLLRGLNQIDNFADNATRAIREAKNALR